MYTLANKPQAHAQVHVYLLCLQVSTCPSYMARLQTTTNYPNRSYQDFLASTTITAPTAISIKLMSSKGSPELATSELSVWVGGGGASTQIRALAISIIRTTSSQSPSTSPLRSEIIIAITSSMGWLEQMGRHLQELLKGYKPCVGQSTINSPRRGTAGNTARDTSGDTGGGTAGGKADRAPDLLGKVPLDAPRRAQLGALCHWVAVALCTHRDRLRELGHRTAAPS